MFAICVLYLSSLFGGGDDRIEVIVKLFSASNPSLTADKRVLHLLNHLILVIDNVLAILRQSIENKALHESPVLAILHDVLDKLNVGLHVVIISNFL